MLAMIPAETLTELAWQLNSSLAVVAVVVADAPHPTRLCVLLEMHVHECANSFATDSFAIDRNTFGFRVNVQWAPEHLKHCLSCSMHSLFQFATEQFAVRQMNFRLSNRVTHLLIPLLRGKLVSMEHIKKI